jgi:hypothetical protein
VLSPASTEDCAFENIGARTTTAQAALPKVHRVWLMVIRDNLKSGKGSIREPCRVGLKEDRAAAAKVPQSVPDWRERLRCSQCGSRNIEMVVSGTERR